MNLLWRLVKLFFGLIYRLIVLALFERWIPFDNGKQPEPKPQKRQKQQKQQKQQKAATAAPSQQRKAKPQPQRSYREADFFLTRSIEPAPELVSAMEGEHMRIARKQVARPPKGSPSLKAMLQDRRAVRDAVILGAVLSPPRHRR